MVHSEVYLNKYVVSIAPFSTPACPDCSQNIQKTAAFCMFSLFNFSSIFFQEGGSADPIRPDVRTLMLSVVVAATAADSDDDDKDDDDAATVQMISVVSAHTRKSSLLL